MKTIYAKIAADVRATIMKQKESTSEALRPIAVDPVGKAYRNDLYVALYTAKVSAARAVQNYISRQTGIAANTRFFNQEIIPVIKTKTIKIVDKNIIKGTQDKLKQVIVQAMKEGATQAQLIQRLDMITGNWATIARTETNTAAGEAGWNLSIDTYRQLGAVGEFVKGWQTSQDELVRETHVQAGIDYGDGKEIPLEDPFIVGDGEAMWAPGGTGLPEEDINCRCNEYIIPKP